MRTRALLPLAAVVQIAVAVPTARIPPTDDSSEVQGVLENIYETAENLAALTAEAWQEFQQGLSNAGQSASHQKDRVEGLTFETWESIQGAIQHDVEPLKEHISELSSEAWQSIQGLLGGTDGQSTRVLEGLAESRSSDRDEVVAFSRHRDEESIDLSQYTIGEILNWTLHHSSADHTLPLHRLAWLVNISDPVNRLLHDENGDFTLFAPDDSALTPPHHNHNPATPDSDVEVLAAPGVAHPFWTAESFLRKGACPHHHAMTAAHPDNEPDERKERRRRIFKHLVELVLLYHVSPGSKTIPEILDSSTLGSALPISLDKKTPTFRVHVGRPSLIPPGHVKLNFFSTLRKRPVLAKNGVIYIIEGHPLLPPLTPLSEMFLFPDVFSTLTSAIQQIGLDGLLLPHYDNKPIHANFGDYGDEDTVDERVMLMLREIAEEKSKLSKRSFTIFAPSNRAFKKLGWGANAAIFSPFARGLLHHVLSYHVVPDLVFHTDHIDNTAASLVTGADVDVDLGGTYDNFASWNWNGPSGSPINAPEALTKPGKVNVTHFELPTLLGSHDNETLAVDVAQYRLHWGNGPIVRRVVVKPPPFCGKPQHPIPALVADLPAWGGAIHIIGDVIKPPISGHPICKHIREGH